MKELGFYGCTPPRTANWLVAVICGLFISTASADIVDIYAEFVPDPSNPKADKFVNKTPPSGYCAAYPTVCNQLKVFSVETNITAESLAPLQPGHSVRNGPMFQIPSHWSDVDIVNEDGDSSRVQLRVTSIGAVYNLSDPVRNLVSRPDVTIMKAHGLLWGGRENDSGQGLWSSPLPPCTNAANLFSPGNYSDVFFWKVPVQHTCAKTAAFVIPRFSYSKLGFMYELTTPEPLKMKAGIYKGNLRYSVGPRMDFDLGDVMIPSDNELYFNFTLKVDHIFKIEIPPGGDKVALIPEGGWNNWLASGRRPTRLFRDQTFVVWTSTPFKMSMECEHYAANSTCAIQDDRGNQAAVDVSVSLPFGLSDAALQPVARRPLRVDGVGTEKFQPTQYVDRKPGTLHFEVAKDAVQEMLTHDSLRYSGDITVIWDSEV